MKYVINYKDNNWTINDKFITSEKMEEEEFNNIAKELI